MTIKRNFVNTDTLLKEAFEYCQNNELLRAKKIYDELILLIPNETQILTNLGTIEIQLGNNQKGLELLKKSISINPLQSNVLCNLANLLTDLGSPKEALHYYQEALEIEKNQAFIYYNQGRALKKINHINESIDSYTKAIHLDSNYFLAYFNRGLLFHELGNFDAALQDFNETVCLQKDFYPVLYNRARLYQDMKNFDAAIQDYNRVIYIKPDYAESFNNRGMAFHQLGNYDAALKDYNEAISLKESYADAISNRGALYRDFGDLEKAITEYKYALKIDNKHIDALYNLGLTYLKNKNFDQGWPLYEKRLELSEYLLSYNIKEFQKLTNNLSIKNKSLLILSEQGLGDEIFFSRMIKKFKDTEAKITCLVDTRLVKLFQRSFDSIHFISKDVAIETITYDYAISFGSLGYFLNYKPNNEKSYLVSNKEGALPFKKIIKKRNSKYICGISWKSANPKLGEAKSITLEKLLPLLNMPNTTYINLQYGNIKDEINFIKNKYHIDIINFDEINYYKDIDTVVSLIDVCDFVISTSNITAHLSGALNKNTYLVLPYANAKIWYWHEGQGSSMWYPTIKLFSQTYPNNWDTVITELSENLKSIYYA